VSEPVAIARVVFPVIFFAFLAYLAVSRWWSGRFDRRARRQRDATKRGAGNATFGISGVSAGDSATSGFESASSGSDGGGSDSGGGGWND